MRRSDQPRRGAAPSTSARCSLVEVPPEQVRGKDEGDSVVVVRKADNLSGSRGPSHPRPAARSTPQAMVAFDHVAGGRVEDDRQEHSLGGDVSLEARVLLVVEGREELPTPFGHSGCFESEQDRSWESSLGEPKRRQPSHSRRLVRTSPGSS